MLPRIVRPLHWRMARVGKPTPGQPYIGPSGLVVRWARASTPTDQAVAALAMLFWGFVLRVSEVATVTPADLTQDKLPGFCSSKVGGFEHLNDQCNPRAQLGSCISEHMSWLWLCQRASLSSAGGGGQPIWRSCYASSCQTRFSVSLDGADCTEEGRQPSTGPPSQPTLVGGVTGASSPRRWSTRSGTVIRLWWIHLTVPLGRTPRPLALTPPSRFPWTSARHCQHHRLAQQRPTTSHPPHQSHQTDLKNRGHCHPRIQLCPRLQTMLQNSQLLTIN